MKLIPAFLLGGMLAMSDWPEDGKPEPYSAEMMKEAKAQYDRAVLLLKPAGQWAEDAKPKPYSAEMMKEAEAGDAKAIYDLAILMREPTPVWAIASLTDPKKLATQKGERAYNPRLQKCLYWLATARNKGESLAYIMALANQKNGQQITPYGILLSSSLIANLAEADKLGLLSREGLGELRQGQSATITQGEYAGQEATADHYIPRSVCPELDNQIFNLRLLPSKLNSSKGDKVGKEQVEYAEELHRNGLLSQGGLDAVQTAYKKDIILPPAPPPLTQEERDKVERENQVAMEEESRRLAIEDVRAEQKGWGAVYELRAERTKKQAEKANKTKASSDVLIFEKMVSNTLEALSQSIDQRGFTYRMPSANPNLAGAIVPKSYMMDDEAKKLENLLDESLRAK